MAKKCLACNGTGKHLSSVAYLIATKESIRDNLNLVEGVKDLAIERVEALIKVARGMSAALELAYLRGKQDGEESK